MSGPKRGDLASTHYSMLAYPGGKGWFIPRASKWLRETGPVDTLVEPFAGSAVVGLWAVFERRARRAVLSDLDPNVVALWSVVFGKSERDADRLARLINEFQPTRSNAEAVVYGDCETTVDAAFRTLVRNRYLYGGVIDPAMGKFYAQADEQGRRRWIREALIQRLYLLRSCRRFVTFEEADALAVLEEHPDAHAFVDPPYTAGGDNAGARLYARNELDHSRLFDICASRSGPSVLTYDDNDEVRALASERRMRVERVPMKSGRNRRMHELAIWADR